MPSRIAPERRDLNNPRQMVNDVIARIGSEYFSFLRAGNDEASRRFWRVGSCVEFITQRIKIIPQVGFKPLLIKFESFVVASIKPSLTQAAVVLLGVWGRNKG